MEFDFRLEWLVQGIASKMTSQDSRRAAMSIKAFKINYSPHLIESTSASPDQHLETVQPWELVQDTETDFDQESNKSLESEETVLDTSPDTLDETNSPT